MAGLWRAGDEVLGLRRLAAALRHLLTRFRAGTVRATGTVAEAPVAPCRCCRTLKPVAALSRRCPCRQATCADCLWPLYWREASGPLDVAGWLCDHCLSTFVELELIKITLAPWQMAAGEGGAHYLRIPGYWVGVSPAARRLAQKDGAAPN